MSTRQLLRDLIDTLPDPISEPAWRRFMTTFDVVGRYVYRLPVEAERDDVAWQALLAEQHDDVAETIELLANERAALQSLITALSATEILVAAQADAFAEPHLQALPEAEPVAIPEEAPSAPVEQARAVEAPTLTCDVCGRTFAKRNALTMHVRSHQGSMMTNAVTAAMAAESSAAHTVAQRIREREATPAQNEQIDETFETFEERRLRFAAERVASNRASF